MVRVCIYFRSAPNGPDTGHRVNAVNRLPVCRARPSTEAFETLLVLLLAVWSGLLASPVVAQKTDVVHMSNGNVITGEVKRMEHGLMEYSVDDIVNRLQIKWKYVTRLTSNQQFDIELENGSGFFGSLIESEADDTLRILTAFGTFDVERQMVVEIIPIEGTFWKRLEGDVSAGLSYTKSTDLLQFNLGGKARYRRLKSQTDFNYSSIISSRTDEPEKTNSALQLTHLRFFKRKWFYRGDAVGSRNDELGIDFRASLAGGVGRHVVQTNRVHFLISTLLSGNREFTSDGQITNNLELVLDTALLAFRYDTPKLELDSNLAAFYSLTNVNRYRVNFSGRLSLELGLEDFFWDIGQLYYLYDSEPSNRVITKDDYGIISGLRYRF